MQVMRIEIGESAHAFRVNGVTIAKRHLKASLPDRANEGDDKTLARYLTIVPFLHEAYVPKDDAPECIKYGAFKAKRLYKALGLTQESIAPFMLMCMSQSGDLPTADNFVETAAPFQSREREDSNVIPFPEGGRKVTIH
jgi:hypothetical protein